MKNNRKKNKKKIPNKKIQKKIPKKIVQHKYEKVKVRKIRYGRILVFLLIIFLLFYLISTFVKFPIKNIFIYNNQILSDQEIIELASLENYPSIFYKTSFSIEKMLEKNIYIKDAKVKKRSLSEIAIYIEENNPLFYDTTLSKTIFENKETTTDILKVPVLINYVPDTIYDDFIKKMSEIDTEILNRISEIKYDPNTVDTERFLLTMSDGNYVYLTLEEFDKINSYVDIYLDIIGKYGNKIGILYLDSGEYFKILE
ncbi:MAG: FtsQ-type POTRA domain-containing protein [Bacilli bacterium]|nr:FtsQ-type POTRA domain-containing protein [Bacilli bacterium]